VWKDGKQNFPVRCQQGKTVKSVQLGRKTIPDVDAANNSWKKGE